jgi:excisionase family DNA binding protein
MVMDMQAPALAYSPQPVSVSAHPGLTRDQVMTAAEVADLLALPVSTVYYLARRGDIPACRFGRACRFLRPRIEELLGA